HGQRQDAHVDRREAAERHGEDEGADRYPGETHRLAPAFGRVASTSTRTRSPISSSSSSRSTIENTSSTRAGGSTREAQSLNFSNSSSRVNGRSGPPRYRSSACSTS